MLRQQRLYDLFSMHFSPIFIDIQNESNQHSVPVGSESHFKVVLVSTAFETHSLISRHRLVNHLVEPELTTGLHALSLHLYTPEEWEQRGQPARPSPLCKGGSQHASNQDR